MTIHTLGSGFHGALLQKNTVSWKQFPLVSSKVCSYNAIKVKNLLSFKIAAKKQHMNAQLYLGSNSTAVLEGQLQQLLCRQPNTDSQMNVRYKRFASMPGIQPAGSCFLIIMSG